MTELKSNSNKSRIAKDKNIKPVVEGTVKKKKKNEIQKFTDIFLADDFESLKESIFKDLLIPLLKSGISEIIKNGSDILLYGETSGNRRSKPGSRISYDKIISDKVGRRNYSSVQTPGYDYGNIILDSRADAEELLDNLDAILEQYEAVSVADLYDLIGVTHEYTDNNYGWESLASAVPVRLRDGTYTIKLPKARPL